MKLRELIDELSRKNINLEDFEIAHITPCVRFEKINESLIEVVESFGIEFERKEDEGFY